MVVNVLVEISNFNIDKVFSYLVPKNLENKIQIGIRVKVPFNKIILEGFILSINNINEEENNLNLKQIIDIIDDYPVLNDELLKLGQEIKKDTLSTLISSYQVMLPKALKANRKTNINKKIDKYILINKIDNNLTEKQKEIINEFKNKDKIIYTQLKKINSSVDTLIKNNILKIEYIEDYRLKTINIEKEEKKELTIDQKNIVNEVINNINKNITYLLHGITGSGKTEVYMEIIENVIKNKKQALLLVPEITLTNQILHRFKTRFDNIAILHSALNDGEKYDEYRRISKGIANIVIGTRSSIFAPLNNIGIIIIDEAHSETYLQDNMPRYDAIEIAKKRSIYHNCPIILGTATPTLDQYARAKKNIYKLLELNKRINNNKLPNIILANMQTEKRINKTSISETLYNKIKEKLEKKEQIILLINRRGYSTSVNCIECGYVYKCPSCNISMVYHKNKDMLRCHYCGYATPLIKTCPNCKGDKIRELGSGTEKIEEEIEKLFKESKILRMDLDTTRKKGSNEKMIIDFKNHKYDILIGTQMISKGLDFNDVTLVGIINADTTLTNPSFSASEKTFQLLTQTSGRSGRNKQGDVVIQTYNIDHYAIEYAIKNDYNGFYNREMKERFYEKYPPYYYLVNIKVKSNDYDLLTNEINKIYYKLLQELDKSIINKPAMDIPFMLNKTYRFNILIKYQYQDNLREVLTNLINYYLIKNKIKIEINFNNYSI